MPVPTALTDLSTSPAGNYPAGSEPIGATDDYLRSHAAFLAQLRDSKEAAGAAAAVLAALASIAAGKGGSLVAVIAAGAGAVLRDLLAKSRDRSSLLDRGAVADDATVCSPAVAAVTTLAFDHDAPSGTYRIGDAQLSAAGLHGMGTEGTTLKATAGAATVLRLGYSSSLDQWTKKGISALTIDGNGKASAGVTFGASAVTAVSGRWHLQRVTFKNCSIGVNKPSGNIGNLYEACSWISNDYGYYAVGVNSPEQMHAGNDTFVSCHLQNSALAAIYINSPVGGTGATAIRDTVIESNPGFGLFVKNYKTAVTPLLLDNVWFENNATAASVTIDGVVYTPKDIYLENVDRAVLANGIVPDIQLVNSKLTLRDSFASSSTTTYSLTNSYIEADGMHFEGGVHPVLVRSVSGVTQPLGNFCAAWLAPARRVSFDRTSVVLSQDYANANSYSWSGSVAVTGTTQADGRIFDACCELSVPAGATLVNSNLTFNAGSWYVITLDAKLVSGSGLTLNIAGGGSAVPNIASLLQVGQWVTLAAIGKAEITFAAPLQIINGGASAAVLRLSAYQVVAFNTEAEALAFYNAGLYISSLSRGRTVYSTSAPTTGTWDAGDRAINSTPTVGQPKSWVCTVSGTPGTWASEGSL